MIDDMKPGSATRLSDIVCRLNPQNHCSEIWPVTSLSNVKAVRTLATNDAARDREIAAVIAAEPDPNKREIMEVYVRKMMMKGYARDKRASYYAVVSRNHSPVDTDGKKDCFQDLVVQTPEDPKYWSHIFSPAAASFAESCFVVPDGVADQKRMLSLLRFRQKHRNLFHERLINKVTAYRKRNPIIVV